MDEVASLRKHQQVYRCQAWTDRRREELKSSKKQKSGQLEKRSCGKSQRMLEKNGKRQPEKGFVVQTSPTSGSIPGS